MSGEVEVHGGSYSIAADFEQLPQLAVLLDATAAELASTTGQASALLIDPRRFGAAVLDPYGAWELEAQLGASVVCGGIAAGACSVLATSLRFAAGAYQQSDDLLGRAQPVLDLLHHPSLPAIVGSAVDAASWASLPLTAPFELAEPGRGGSSTAVLASVAGQPYRDGRPELLREPPSAATMDAAGPPRTAGDLLQALSFRDALTDGGGIDVRIVRGSAAHGAPTRGVIVNIPGTKDWALTRFTNANVSDMGTNLRAMANETTAYERGIVLALQASGVRPDEPIMLVGHSQGGMVAARLAADLAHSRRFNVTHVLTAGSPIGLIEMPRSVQVMSLENRGDPIPALDGAANRHHARQLTVEINRGGLGIHGKHGLETSYLAGAGDADSSRDPSIREWFGSAERFLTADGVQTQVFTIRRG